MSINDILIKIIVFIIIILLGLVVSKFVHNLAKKIVKEFELSKVFRKADIKLNPDKIPLFSKYIVYILTAVIALNTVGITRIILYGVVVILLFFIIGYFLLSARNLIPNWFYGSKIRKKYKVGDSIKCRNINGRIVHMNLVELQIKTKKEVVYIPYRLLR